jgi:8-amino-7-oxononanoate synthase
MLEHLERRVRAHLAGLEREGLRRTLRPPCGIDLSSNDYLGLAQHPLIKERLAAAVAELGCGSTGSRLLRGERECFDAIEQRFARFKGTERALYFSSGYLANLAVLTTFAEAGDTIYSDERNHASIVDGARLSRAARVVYPHNRPPVAGSGFIVTESLFSMDGDFAPLPALAASGAALIVDEAHAVGIFGERGSGWIEETGARPFLSVNTAGKALGVMGAFVAGPAWAIEYLVQRARPFIFSTAALPAVTAALDASLDLIEAEPERRARLRWLARRLRERLRASGLDVALSDSPIVPIVIGDNRRAVAAAAELQRAGYDVRAIRPPTVPPGGARLRVSVNCALTEEVLDGFAAALEQSLCVASS